MSIHTRIIAESDEMRAVLRQLERVSAIEVPVHIAGETGTGKELAARWLHVKSPRSRGIFGSCPSERACAVAAATFNDPG